MTLINALFFQQNLNIFPFFRYTDRRGSAVHHFNQALAIDPVFWAAYEELCILGLWKNCMQEKCISSICMKQQYIMQFDPYNCVM